MSDLFVMPNKAGTKKNKRDNLDLLAPSAERWRETAIACADLLCLHESDMSRILAGGESRIDTHELITALTELCFNSLCEYVRTKKQEK